MLDTVDFNHVQHISFTQSLLTDAVSVILSELLSYEHPPKPRGLLVAIFPAVNVSSPDDAVVHAGREPVDQVIHHGK